jgi:membrane protein required for beta-lactamase induction
MLGFAFCGSFDDAISRWKQHQPGPGTPIDKNNDVLTAQVGKAAMIRALEQPANSSAGAKNAMRLVTRTLFLWITLLALMTIAGWAV